MKRRAFLGSTLAAAATAALPRRELFGSSPFTVRRRSQELVALTGDGREVTLTSALIDELRGALRGRLLLAGDDGYDDARRILNPSFDKRPALIAQVTGAADVATAIDFARDHGGLLLAVKCGGHSASGQSTCDRGMMIDLSPFRAVRVDPVGRTARVAGGSLLGQVDHEAMAHELVVTMGTVSHTGVGGLVTGGGFGRLGRRFGLSIDNMLAADVVSADGRFRRTSLEENPDLFWGIRGGGGNFGVVTSFEFRLHPMQRHVVGGDIVFPIARAKDLLRVYADYGPSAPDELQLDYWMAKPPGEEPGVCGFGVCWSGDAAGAERALAPIRALGQPIADELKTMEYVALQRSGDIDDPRAMAAYLKSGFTTGLPAELIDAIVDRFQGDPRRATAVFFQQSGGAIGRVDPASTAFAHRDIRFNMLSAVNWRHGDPSEDHIAWLRQYWSGLEPFTQGFYVNDLELDAGGAKVRENYRTNHDRLVEVKNTYDPGNLFRLNANVRPTAT